MLKKVNQVWVNCSENTRNGWKVRFQILKMQILIYNRDKETKMKSVAQLVVGCTKESLDSCNRACSQINCTLRMAQKFSRPDHKNCTIFLRSNFKNSQFCNPWHFKLKKDGIRSTDIGSKSLTWVQNPWHYF